MADKTIWIVGGGWLQVPAVQAVKELGYRVLVTDVNPNCPCAGLADEFYAVSTSDEAAHEALAGTLVPGSVAAVFTEGADVEVTVAKAAQALGVRGVPVEAARKCKNKAEMRRALPPPPGLPRDVHGGGVGGGVEFEEVETLGAAHAAAQRIGYPVMVKAVDNSASRGVTKVDGPAQMQAAFEKAVAASRTGTALIEQYLEGPQQSVEILFDGQERVHWLNVVDRIFDGTMELGHINPSNLNEAQKADLFTLAEDAAETLGVRTGAFKADTIWTADGPRILEVTARLSGGLDCQATTPLATGRNFIKAAMKAALGKHLKRLEDELAPTRAQYAAAWAAFPPAGTVQALLPTDDVPADQVYVRVQVGDVIDYDSNADRPAFVVVSAPTYAEAESRARAAAVVLAGKIVTG